MKDKPTNSSDYSKKYYATHKEQFKLYYENYKKRKQSLKNGEITEPVQTNKLTKFQKEMMRWNKKLEREQIKKQAFIEKLKENGTIK